MRGICKVLVFGNFGYTTRSLNGQTIKTRSVYDLLKKNEDLIGDVFCFDSEVLSLKRTTSIILIKELIKCNKLVYIPALKNFKNLFPIIFYLSKLFHFKIIHIPVGGRHNDFLIENRIHRVLLSKIQVNLPETNKEVQELVQKFKFKNAAYFPNFRIHNYVPLIKLNKNVDFKICFMARVTPLKGVDAIIMLANSLLSDPVKDRKIKIDFYGPIDEEYKDEFLENIENNSLLNYLGVLEPTDIYTTLSKYDILVLPTKYPGEGFPGTVLDSYISGVPTVVSKWRHLPEFVKHKKTGFLYDLDNEVEFYNYVRHLIINPDIVYEMKLNVFEESKLYSEKIAWEILKQYIIK